MTMSSTDYALLSEAAYRDPVLNKDVVIGGVHYMAVDTENNPHTGFQATAFQRRDTQEVVIAYRGTEFGREPVHDGGVDAGMVLTGINAQARNSEAFTKRVMDKAKSDEAHTGHPVAVTVTGHSLGGTLAEINAAKYGLKGETFNAYGAASLYGVPTGGHQVIDHVRAGDLVSAASPHFGEVRVYADQKDIDRLSKAGYHDGGGLLSPRNPVAAVNFDAHAIDNFVPDSKLLGHSIINPHAEALYKQHQGMIDRYRNDVMDIRQGISAPWEVPKTIAGDVGRVGHAMVDKVEKGVHTLETSVGHAAHEAKETYQHAKADASAGLHALSDKASHAWDTVSHPSSWFGGTATPHLDSPDHPGHALFQQAREGVHKLDAQHGRAPDTQSDQLAGTLTARAAAQGMTRIDHVLLNTDASRAYAVQGDMASPTKRVADVSVQEGVRTPLETSSALAAQKLQEASRAQAQHQHGVQATQPAAGSPNAPPMPGPV